MTRRTGITSDKAITGAGLVVGLVLLLAFNILSNEALTSSRLDLTEGQIFTLSEGTHKVLSKVDEPVNLRFYLSRRLATRLPDISSYATRVEELLEEYRRVSKGKVRLSVIDPEPFSEEEDRAVGYGLQGVPADNEGGTLYFGLVGTNSVDDEEVIPFFSPEREESLEYDLTKLIHNLSTTKQPVIGLISSLPIEGLGPRPEFRGLSSPPWMVLEQIRQLFEVRSIDKAIKSIPEDIDVLLLVHPKRLSNQMLYAIDQFVLYGGRALVFIDAHAEVEQGVNVGGLMVPSRSKRSELDPLLDAWGVILEKDKIVGDLQLAVKVRMEREGRLVTFDYPVWISVQPAQMDQEDTVTGGLGNLSLGTPGSLVQKPGASTRLVPLIKSTAGAAVFTPDKLALTEDPQKLLRLYKPDNRAYTLAARLSGPVNSAFPDGRPAVEASEASAESEAQSSEKLDPPKADRPHRGASSEPVNLIVVADSDFLQDRFWVTVQEFLGSRVAVPTAANAVFVVNALDNLTGSGDLISVRNRGSFVRPFERVNALRQQAELKFRQKEQELIDRLDAAEQKLVDLEEKKQGTDALTLTDEQQKELLQFRQERLRIRKDLRDVRHRLRRDIEDLEDRLKFLNIGVVPLLVALSGVGVAVWRARRRRRALAAA